MLRSSSSDKFTTTTHHHCFFIRASVWRYPRHRRLLLTVLLIVAGIILYEAASSPTGHATPIDIKFNGIRRFESDVTERAVMYAQNAMRKSWANVSLMKLPLRVIISSKSVIVKNNESLAFSFEPSPEVVDHHSLDIESSLMTMMCLKKMM